MGNNKEQYIILIRKETVEMRKKNEYNYFKAIC